MPKGKFRRILRGGMLSALGKKPEITGEVEKIDAYQEIIVGTPVWAGKPAAWLNTVLERPGFAEKVTAAFTLSGGGDNEKCVRWMKERFPNIRETLSLADHYNELSKGNDERISEWIGKLKNE